MQYGVIYVDVLIVTNIFIDYILLVLTSRFVGSFIKTHRLIVAAIFGGIFSLYIFIPCTKPISLLMKIIATATITIIAYGFKDKLVFFKNFLSFFAISLGLSGILYLLWNFVGIPGLIFYNGIFYFDISPVILILSTVICYTLIRFILFVIGKNKSKTDYCKVEIEHNGGKCVFVAKIDTGNTLIEPFTNIPVVVVDFDTVKNILSLEQIENYTENNFQKLLQSNHRAIPYRTIAGEGIIFAFRANSTKINGNTKDAYIGICSRGELKGEIKALINPSLL